MGTNALVAKLNDDNTVTMMMVLSDGYLSFTGARLLKYYNDPSIVDRLVQFDRYQIVDNSDFNPPNKADMLWDEYRLLSSIDDFVDMEWAHKYIFMNGQWFYNDVGEMIPLAQIVKCPNSSKTTLTNTTTKIKQTSSLVRKTFNILHDQATVELLYLRNEILEIWRE